MRGVSLIETMLAGAMVVAIAYGLMSMVAHTTLTTKANDSKLSLQSVVSTIELAVQSGIGCSELFALGTQFASASDNSLLLPQLNHGGAPFLSTTQFINGLKAKSITLNRIYAYSPFQMNGQTYNKQPATLVIQDIVKQGADTGSSKTTGGPTTLNPMAPITMMIITGPSTDTAGNPAPTANTVVGCLTDDSLPEAFCTSLGGTYNTAFTPPCNMHQLANCKPATQADIFIIGSAFPAGSIKSAQVNCNSGEKAVLGSVSCSGPTSFVVRSSQPGPGNSWQGECIAQAAIPASTNFGITVSAACCEGM